MEHGTQEIEGDSEPEYEMEGCLSRISYRNCMDTLHRWTMEEIAKNELLRRAARVLAVACPQCGAEPGRWCRHPGTGKPCYAMHNPRLYVRLPARSSFDIPPLHPDDR